MSLQNRSGNRRRSVSLVGEAPAPSLEEDRVEAGQEPVRVHGSSTPTTRRARRRRTARAQRAPRHVARPPHRREHDSDTSATRVQPEQDREQPAHVAHVLSSRSSNASVPSSNRASRRRSIPSRFHGRIEFSPTIASRVRSGVSMPNASSGKLGRAYSARTNQLVRQQVEAVADEQHRHEHREHDDGGLRRDVSPCHRRIIARRGAAAQRLIANSTVALLPVFGNLTTFSCFGL